MKWGQLPGKYKLLAGLIVLAIGGGVFMLAGNKSAAKASAPQEAGKVHPVLAVSLMSPKVLDWGRVIKANGNIEAWQESQIGVELGGQRLVEVNADVGDVVRKGQLVARFDDATVRAEIAQGEAALQEAQAAYAEAHENANRVRQLGNKGALSAQQITQAMTQESTAMARVESAKAQLNVSNLRLSQTRILAPDEGVISARTATLGAVGQPGQELFRLVRQGRLQWLAEITAAESANIKTGQEVTLKAANGKDLQGTVRKLAPTVDMKTRNVLAYVDLATRNLNDAKPGMYAQGEIRLGASSVLALPASSIALHDGFASVFVVGADMKVREVRVKLGRQESGLIEVSGIDAKAQVVASGAGFLTDGDTVRVVKN